MKSPCFIGRPVRFLELMLNVEKPDTDVLADALGLSAIHVNRVLRELRERKLLALRARKVIIQDAIGLKALAGYQET
jgi:CRP-like cAMP-binding protein